MIQQIDFNLEPIPLQKGVIYGPVNSRRLGRSLGINLLSVDQKICSFDCLYCQYGFTRIRSDVIKNKLNFQRVKNVVNALTKTLGNIRPVPAYITFSGNGEATLHPEFVQIVDLVIKIRNNLAPKVRTAILSNSSQVTDPNIRAALAKLDARIMKLDCGSEEVFRRYNRPRTDIILKDIISHLAQMHDVTIQSLFAKGERGNFFEPHIQDWINAIMKIKPVSVQLYSLDRGTQAKDIQPVTQAELRQIQNMLHDKEIEAQVF